MLNLIEIIKTIILGIIEGVTEWLPISSTGHLILVNEIIQLDVSAKFQEMFNVVIQLGAIMAVVLVYFNKLNPFAKSKNRKEFIETISLWKKVIIGCIPAVILGFILDDFMDDYFNKPIVIALALIVYGIAFIYIERAHKNVEPKINDFKELDFMTAIKIGLFQCLALVPGTSRSGSTILGGLLVGTSRSIATEFSFFMGIPIMFGASGLKLLKFGFHYSLADISRFCRFICCISIRYQVLIEIHQTPRLPSIRLVPYRSWDYRSRKLILQIVKKLDLFQLFLFAQFRV